MMRRNRSFTMTTGAAVFAMAAMLMISSANMANACPGGGPQGGERNGQRMAEQLNLSDRQQEQVKQIRSERRAGGKSIHEAMQLNRDAMRKLNPGSADYNAQVATLAEEKAVLVKQMVMHRSESRAQVYAVLTPEQREKAASLKSQFRKGGKDRGERAGGDGRRCGK